ncbi:DNA cytosine methyltransferase [Halobaculum sp. D14]|uniref:DNA cytosine methyltransferase n=1 Tax=Halobaculum sp. D14 TaxID=3421642 RepID=UPI003EBB5C98
MASDGLDRVCLDLFAGLGGFSAAFENAEGWDVTTVELREDLNPDLAADVLELTPGDLLDAIGTDREEMDAFVVLASPPCTYFSTAGNHDAWNFDANRPTTDEAREAVTLVYHALGLIQALSPDYWFMENPQGRLRWFLGKPTGKVTYCQYGRPYMKRTDLWGDHPPMTYRTCSRGESCHEANREYDGTSAVRVLGDSKEERSKVPRELSETILYAVEDALAGRAPEQATLGGETLAE